MLAQCYVIHSIFALRPVQLHNNGMFVIWIAKIGKTEK